MDYSCIKFDDFVLSRFGFIMRTDKQTHRITDADDRYTDATIYCRRSIDTTCEDFRQRII